MSDVTLPPVDPIVATVREPVFIDVTRNHQREEEIERKHNRYGWWAAAAFGVIGVLGMASSTAAIIYFTPQVRYTVIDKATGMVEESFGAKDAPAHFPERTIEGAVADYVKLRERFVWQLDSETFHKVTLMSSPDEQKRYAEERTKDDPGKLYGMTGYARVTNIETPRKVGEGKDKTLEYDVHFTKTALLAANMTKPVVEHLTAHIGFQFHPELPTRSKQDRLDNESGLYVVYYSVSNY
jgi:type IV secretion system protein VirB8